MPIYEYQCKNCKEEQEILVLRSDQELSCAACGSEDLERWLSVSGLEMGGTVWHDINTQKRRTV